MLSSNSVSEVEKWSQFIEALQKTKKIPKPFCAVDTLVREYLCQNKSTRSILDIGCETGKNAISLVRAGHNVTLLDIAPNAIKYTLKNLQKMGLDHGVTDRITGKIETLDSKYCPFKAVVGTYVFSHIASGVFQQVIKENVLGRIEPGGYFAGGFFGMEHDWVQKPELSILTRRN
ncbi:MAG: Ubiquinone biosynthesis O-methyltransferase [Chlamydiae bacterium]|nr:Ubiquinone biosynthesis O-methyltransferase [Chlamydiota bacterium]